MGDTTQPLPNIPEITLENVIGKGGMGTVYLGYQSYLDRRVAVKLLTGGSSEMFVARFRREAKILASLAHPNIVTCHQAGLTAEGHCYLVMEYIEGPNLSSWIESNGPMGEAHALDVTMRIAQALEYALRRGVIHRDVKPENILLQNKESVVAGDSFPFVAKLVDLGLARPTESLEDVTKLTGHGVIMGTPSTMAPEQFNDPDAVDHRADIYGLGCVLFHMLTGTQAFPQKKLAEIIVCKLHQDPPDPKTLQPRLNRGVAQLVLRLLAVERDERPQTYAELIAACESSIAGLAQPISGGSTDILDARTLASTRLLRARRRPKRNRTAFLTFLLLACIAAAVGGWMYTTKAAQDQREAIANVEPFATPQPQSSPSSPLEEPLTEPARSAIYTLMNEGTFPSAEFAQQAVPLFRADFTTRLDGWGESIGRAGWNPEDEGEGVYGFNGSGRKSYPLGAGPWLLEGTMDDVQKEAGVRVDLAGGEALTLIAQNLTSSWLISMVPFGPDNPQGVFERRTPLASAVHKGDAIDFQIEVNGKAVRFKANSEEIAAVELSDEVIGFSLYVDGEKARFSNLTYRKR